MEKSKAEESCWEKKKRKKKQTLRRKKEYHSVKKRKNFLCDRDWYWGSSSLASRFQTKFAIHDGHYCVILLNAPLSDQGLKKKKKKVSAIGYFSQEILIPHH